MKKLQQILEGTNYNKTKTREQHLKDAPLNPDDEVRLGGKTEIGRNPVITGHEPFSQQTLAAKSQYSDKAVSQEEIDKLINLYAGQNLKRRMDFVKWLQNGAGVPENYAAKNRRGYHSEETDLTETQKLLNLAHGEVSAAKIWAKNNRQNAVVYHDAEKNHITFRGEKAYNQIPGERKKSHKVLRVINPSWGEETETDMETLTEQQGIPAEVQEKLMNLLGEVVERREQLTDGEERRLTEICESMGWDPEKTALTFWNTIKTHGDPFRTGLQRLLQTYSPHPFHDQEQISEMERWALKVEAAEETLIETRLERRQLEQEVHQIQEEQFYQNFTGVKERRPRNINALEESLEEVDESAADAYYNQEQKHIHSPVSRYFRKEDGRLHGMPRGNL